MCNKYFWDIPDMVEFIKLEKIKRCNSNVLTCNDYKVINKVDELCILARDIINSINYNNFPRKMKQLIEVDAKISLYLFFLINVEEINLEDINRIVEKDFINDYYNSLSYDDHLNKYKLITYC